MSKNEREVFLIMMVQHMRGSLQMFHQRGHTAHTLVTISIVSSLCSMFIVMSLGSSSQFGNGREKEAIMLKVNIERLI
jgi:hypothetical protein